MLNRTLSPEIKQVNHIDFLAPNTFSLGEISRLYWMKDVPDETVHLEFHFNAGSVQGEKNMASFVNALLLSGTEQKSSSLIQEELDQLGAYVDHEISIEKAFISVYCLRKNADEVWSILFDAITNVSFHQHEVDDMLLEKKQRFLVSNEKVGFLARKLFQKELFSTNELYARQTELEDFNRIDIAGLKKFHQTYYLNGLKKIVVVANLEQAFIDRLIADCMAWIATKPCSFAKEVKNRAGSFHFEKKGALQTAIRVGIPLFNKKHDDFIAFQFMQTILGDYFGSRLMSNIREDKGYTYGIGCALVELKESGYFVIATEVGADVCNETLKEIRIEIEKLQQEPVSDEELELVKNYLLGQMLKSADGPNAMMDLFLGAEQHNLTQAFYNHFMEKMIGIRKSDIQQMAKKYLDWDKFTIVTAGIRN